MFAPRSSGHDLDALRKLYAEADALLEGWTCPASTDCCHFARIGREPHLWPNEWALLDKAIAARGARRGPLQLVEDEDDRCPLLKNGRCSVYEARPLGCRTYFCEKASGPTRRPRDDLAEVGRRIAALATREDPECDGPRPLSTWLASRRR